MKNFLTKCLSASARRVAVIDSSPFIARLLALGLEKRGHEAQTATDGRSGVDLVKAMEPEVVVCCIELPHLTGYEVAQEIRGSLIKQPRLIANTTYWGDEFLERAKAAGFDLHLFKPTSFVELFRAVECVAENECDDLHWLPQAAC